MISLVLLVHMAAGGWADLTAMPPRRERGLGAAQLLEAGTGELSQEAQQLSYEASLRALEDFELPLGLRIGEALHGRVGESWSGFNLALGLQRAGHVTRADELFVRLLEQALPHESAGLWSQRGLLAFGGGDAGLGLRHMGHGLVLGSADSAAVLARRELARHNLTRARNGFRSALARDPKHPWALRGWGLSLLP